MEAQTLDLPEKDFKLTIINMFKEPKETMSEISSMRMRSQIENINKEIKF